MSTTLYRKYRPQSWSDVAGQNHVKVTLEFEVSTGRIAHAYLFSGPRGVGKTTIARIMAKALNCLDKDQTADKRGSKADACGKCASCVAITDNAALDVIEIDAASHRGIDAVRDNVIEHARFAPAKLAYKVFIIDEVHMLTTEAFNALLKTLEEPPKNVVFILATTELHKVPATIVSRCQRFDFRKIAFTDLTERLELLADNEKCKVDRRTIEEIARHSDGCLRDAEGLLGKVMAVGDGKRVTYDQALVVLPRSDYASLSAFVDALLRRDARTALGTIGDCLEGGTDLDQFAGDATELLRKTLLAKMAGDAGIFALELDEERKAKLTEWAGLADTSTLVRAIETLLEKRQDMKRAHPVQLPLELAVVRICEGVSAAPVAAAPVATMAAPAPKAPVKKAEPAKAPVQQVAPVQEQVPEQVPEKEPAMMAAGATPEAWPTASIMDAEPTPETKAIEVAAAVAMVEQSLAAEATASTLEATVATEKAPKTHVTTVQVLKARWTEFVHRAGEENHALSYLLGVGEPVRVEGDHVRIGFDFAFHKDKMNEEKNRRLIEKALGAIVGAVVRIEGVLLEKKDRVGHDASAAFAVSSPAPRATAGGPVAGDGMLSAFGGRVVE